LLVSSDDPACLYEQLKARYEMDNPGPCQVMK